MVVLCILVAPFQGCDVARQAGRASALASCDFRIGSVEHVSLAGVDLQNIRSVSDLRIADVAMILGGFASPVFPLTLQLNLEGRNPNPKEAGLNRLEWILFIDDLEMAGGILDQPFVIPPKGVVTIPVEVGMDLKKVLSGKSATALMNFCVNLAGAGTTPTRFKIKLKPSLMVGGTVLPYPGYITVRTEYLSK
jgi:hypothetical protein